MFLLFGAFIAGILTVIAPCVLPLLPIIIGGSLTEAKNKNSRLRPVIIASSLAVSLILFTLLLKVSTILINVPPEVYIYVSGGIIVALGIVILFPSIFEEISAHLNLQAKSQSFLRVGLTQHQNLIGPVLIGVALGPVFSSCSPVYAYILASVLPVNFGRAISYMVAYILGLSVVLLLVSVLGQRFVQQLKWASNPRGWFQRGIACIFIVVGILIITGNNVRLETYVSAHTPLNLDSITAKLLPNKGQPVTVNSILNVKPYTEPQFQGLTNWINSPPLQLSQLKGKVVLVDFWTYSCINCIRSLPYLEGFYKTYNADGLVVVGIEAPEFSFERVPANVDAAVAKDGITYPVASDNNLSTWSAFNNEYWPADYLIDKQGNVRRVYDGEGGYVQMESAIRTLLASNGGTVPKARYLSTAPTVPVTASQTPETYLGADKQDSYYGPENYTLGTQTFTPVSVDTIPLDTYTLGGSWNVQANDIVSEGNSSTLIFRAAARDVYLVGGAQTATSVGVTLNGQPISMTKDAGQDVVNSAISFSMPQLYRVIHEPSFNSDILFQLSVPKGVSLNSFTFGS